MVRTIRISIKKCPFARLVLALIAGILAAWYFQLSLITLLPIIAVVSAMIIGFSFLPLAKKFGYRWSQGMLILLLVAIFGSVITRLRDIRQRNDWFGHFQQSAGSYLVSLDGIPEQKPRSFKAIATVNAIRIDDKWQASAGKILIYFQKEGFDPNITYGYRLVFNKPLQKISNTGNPGAFDYNRYCLFQDITAQVYLTSDGYEILEGLRTNRFTQLVIGARTKTLDALRKNIHGEKELGVAEALLIGYRADLDKDLVQAYSNTGVVHVIAISGLHLGMLYGLLSGLFRFSGKRRAVKFTRALTILSVLWIFTIVAGAAPSILRSAIMFSFIVLGDVFSRRTNIYNTLAASAFCMLVIDPFVLWDVGFLLSYAAVIGIVTFMMPIYRRLYFENKILDNIWKLTSITLSAQVLTIPIVIFYFHQFPNLFLFTNLLVVPLSGLILYSEILLLIFAPFDLIASWLGNIIGLLIHWMNLFIERTNQLPFAVWNNLQLNVLQTWLFYGIIIFCCAWLIKKSRFAFIAALTSLALFIVSISTDMIQRNNRQQLIVYNIPKMSAIDLTESGYFHFTGDSALINEQALQNFYLRPSRVLNRTTDHPETVHPIPPNQVVNINGLRVLRIDGNFRLPNKVPVQKIPIHLVLLTKNPKLSISQLHRIFSFSEIIFDSSNSMWKIQLWKKDCDSLHLRFHSTAESGAYVMEL